MNIVEQNKIDTLLKEKAAIVEKLISVLNKTSDTEIRNRTALLLVDNFKDERIVPALKNLIQMPELKNTNAKLVFALGEYYDCKDQLDFLTDLILEFDFHVAWVATSIIIDMQPPFEKVVVENNLKKVLAKKNISDEKMEFVNTLIDYFENIIERQSESRID
ncbi:MAG: hypothetical protein A2W93_03075 [Bacteroidetes bacterium GWF2_43_63]|nr:MAG: hypothetical protein A2W94_09075 [Bacteroidetes bacterium GWE2_42_42]OFY53646.1 MAG: hypothetical protein A2W93_03075 [Bacteroidetes bacterium GWF2_43_63]HBG71013.1 hypothetical protein [Bacteroidales bacterium]HCB63591.1 hypothetical protein [Bacteroidales bacterium]HCY24340.1 hypothetical protein [Bacteroidales bacterium]